MASHSFSLLFRGFPPEWQDGLYRLRNRHRRFNEDWTAEGRKSRASVRLAAYQRTANWQVERVIECAVAESEEAH